MRYQKIRFNNFSVDADKIVETLPQYKSPKWALDWTLVFVEDTCAFLDGYNSTKITEWLKTEAQGNWDLLQTTNGYLVAFEDETDSFLFKIANGVAK